MNIVEKIDAAILNITEGLTPLDLNESIDLIDDLGFDSINIISLVISLETELDITIPDDFLVLENLRSYSIIKEKVISLLSLQENIDDLDAVYSGVTD